MKKRTTLLITLLALFCSIQLVYAKSDPNQKAALKAAKIQSKKLSKEGWCVSGAVPIETKIYNYLMKTQDYGGNFTTSEGMSLGNNEIDDGKDEASSNAQAAYAKRLGSVIKGRVDKLNTKLTDAQKSHFISGFEQRYVTELQGEISESVVLYRKSNSGKYDVQIFFLIDKNAAISAEERALKKAAKEVEGASEVGEAIGKFINGGENK